MAAVEHRKAERTRDAVPNEAKPNQPMEKPMNTIMSTAARRIVISTLAAVAMAMALPQAGFAAGNLPEAGLWKINPALSNSNAWSSRLVIERAKATDGTAGAFVVISRGNIYLATPATASSGVQPVDHGAWKGMKLTHIGRGARAINVCGSGCRFGEVSDRLTVTFRNTGAGAETMDSVLALNR
jgi:hypothetical protein